MPEQRSAFATRPTLSERAARLMIDAARAEAEAMSVPVTVVVVDESGVTKELLRMDGAPLVSVQTAINKAFAAVAIGMPPDDFYAAIESDGAAAAKALLIAVWTLTSGAPSIRTSSLSTPDSSTTTTVTATDSRPASASATSIRRRAVAPDTVGRVLDAVSASSILPPPNFSLELAG